MKEVRTGYIPQAKQELSRAGYYARSIGTLVSEFEDPRQTVAIFMGNEELLPAEVKVRNSDLRFKIRSAMDFWILKENVVDQDYLWVVQNLEPEWNIVDIGASIGDFSVLAAKQSNLGVVHAYEPSTEAFKLLGHNLKLNNIDNTLAFAHAVASGAGFCARWRH